MDPKHSFVELFGGKTKMLAVGSLQIKQTISQRKNYLNHKNTLQIQAL